MAEHHHSYAAPSPREEKRQKRDPYVLAIREADVSTSQLTGNCQRLLDVRPGYPSEQAFAGKAGAAVHDSAIHCPRQLYKVAAGTARQQPLRFGG